MAILELTSTEVVQRCAKCDTERSIPLSDIQVGVEDSPLQGAETRLVPLPACPTCKSTEFLIRSEDNEPEHPAPGSFGHLHKLLVDHLHSELVKANRVTPKLRDQDGKADQRIAKPLAHTTRTRWFRNGLKIVPPKESGSGPTE